jgi:diadenosine tetraphosphate (Ap4A) HIT family hydrolase
MKWKAPHEWEQLKQGIGCPICADMHLEENRFSFKVAELQQGIVRLARNQYLPGYTLVIFRRHANELFELSASELTEFWQDVSRTARVLYDLYHPTKVNYLVYGHHCPHLHCHLVVHSYEDDPSKPVNWNEETVLLSPQQYQHLITQMQRKFQEFP